MTLKESETLELKRSTSELKEAITAISAMLNKHGQGEVIFGVEDNGIAAGQDIGKTTISDISKSITDHIEPEVFPAIHEEIIDGKPCIRVVVKGNQMPYFAYGRVHTRVGDKNPLLSSRELEGLFEKKNQARLRWDDQPCPNAKLGDIDPEKLQVFLSKAKLEFESVEISLRKLGLMEADGSLANAAILLFGRSPQTFFRHFGLRCAVFVGAATILDQKEYQGGLFELIDNAQEYVMKNTHTGGRLEGLVMVDVPEINPDSLREAVVNAFCHRNYGIPDTVDIAVYSDRVDIISPGLLYGGLTLERILQGGARPERRNPLLADILHRVHLVEKWGRGIKIIMANEPTASFGEVGRHFITTFKRKNVPEKVPENIDEKRLKSTRKVPEKLGVRLGEKLGVRLGENEASIFQLIGENNQITIPELAKELQISSTAVENNLSKLKSKGLLKRVGPDKGGHWEVIGKG